MSTQNVGFPAIPFSITHPQQSFRLIELPPEVLEIIETSKRDGTIDNSKNTNSHPARIQFKSSVPLPGLSQSANKSTDHFLHLCTADHIWAVRQVSTSNSVHITASSPPVPVSEHSSRATEDGDAMDYDQPVTLADVSPGNGITAIAQVSNILELIPRKIALEDVEGMVRERVGVYSESDLENTRQRGTGIRLQKKGDISMSGTNTDSGIELRKETTTYTLRELYDDIPAPTNLITSALRSLRVFRLPSTSNSAINEANSGEERVYLSSPTLQLKAWKHLIQTAAITSTNLDNEINFTPLLEIIREDEDEENRVVYAAVLESVILSLLTITESMNSQSFNHLLDNDEEQGRLFGKLDSEKTCTFVGKILATSLCAESIDRIVKWDQLQQKWTDLIPDSWSRLCTPELLGEDFDMRKTDGNEDLIVHLKTAPGISGTVSDISQETTQTKPSTAATGKRKWHEKFAAQRNIKK